MRRVLPQKEFASWLREFLPQIPARLERARRPQWIGCP